MARQRSFRGRSVGISQSQRRKKSWNSFGTGGNIAAGVNLSIPAPGAGPSSALAVSGITSVNAGRFVEGTIIRIRGSIELPKSSTLVADNTVIAFGIGFVTDEAFAAAAVPNPALAEGADWDGWMFYRSILQGSLDANAGVFDVKSMRKWNDGMTFALIAGEATDTGTGVGQSQVQIIARSLILLP